MKMVFLALASCVLATAAFAESILTADEVTRKYIGKTFNISWTNGKDKDVGSETLTAKGSMKLKMKSGWSDTGTWKLQGNKLCQQWKKGTSGCSPVYIEGKSHVWKGGGERTIFNP